MPVIVLRYDSESSTICTLTLASNTPVAVGGEWHRPSTDVLRPSPRRRAKVHPPPPTDLFPVPALTSYAADAVPHDDTAKHVDNHAADNMEPAAPATPRRPPRGPSFNPNEDEALARSHVKASERVDEMDKELFWDLVTKTYLTQPEAVTSQTKVALRNRFTWLGRVSQKYLAAEQLYKPSSGETESDSLANIMTLYQNQNKIKNEKGELRPAPVFRSIAAAQVLAQCPKWRASTGGRSETSLSHRPRPWPATAAGSTAAVDGARDVDETVNLEAGSRSVSDGGDVISAALPAEKSSKSRPMGIKRQKLLDSVSEQAHRALDGVSRSVSGVRDALAAGNEKKTSVAAKAVKAKVLEMLADGPEKQQYVRELLERTKALRVPVSPVGGADTQQQYAPDSGSVKNGQRLTSVHSDEVVTDGDGRAELRVRMGAHGDPARFAHGADRRSSRAPPAAELGQLPMSGGRGPPSGDPERLGSRDSARDLPARGRGDMASQPRRHVPVTGDLPQLATGGIAAEPFRAQRLASMPPVAPTMTADWDLGSNDGAGNGAQLMSPGDATPGSRTSCVPPGGMSQVQGRSEECPCRHLFLIRQGRRWGLRSRARARWPVRAGASCWGPSHWDGLPLKRGIWAWVGVGVYDGCRRRRQWCLAACLTWPHRAHLAPVLILLGG